MSIMKFEMKVFYLYNLVLAVKTWKKCGFSGILFYLVDFIYWYRLFNHVEKKMPRRRKSFIYPVVSFLKENRKVFSTALKFEMLRIAMLSKKTCQWSKPDAEDEIEEEEHNTHEKNIAIS